MLEFSIVLLLNIKVFEPLRFLQNKTQTIYFSSKNTTDKEKFVQFAKTLQMNLINIF